MSPIPAEERKFKRRKIMAFIPVCKREREEADSHALSADVPTMGVEVGELSGVASCAGKGVSVS